MSVFTFLPPATKLGQGYVFTGVCHSVNRGEYLTPHPPDLEQTHPPRTWSRPPQTRYTPQTRCPPGSRHPLEQTHPPGTRYTPWDQVHTPGPGTPQEQTPPGTRYTPHHPPMQSMLGDTVNTRAVRYPTGMQSCFFDLCRPVQVLQNAIVKCGHHHLLP